MKGLQVNAKTENVASCQTTASDSEGNGLLAYPPSDAIGSPAAPTSNKFMIVRLLLSGTISKSATDALGARKDLPARGADRPVGRKALVSHPSFACAHGRAEVIAKDMITSAQ